MPGTGRSQLWARKELHFGYWDCGGHTISPHCGSPFSSMVLLVGQGPEEVLTCKLDMSGFERDPRT